MRFSCFLCGLLALAGVAPFARASVTTNVGESFIPSAAGTTLGSPPNAGDTLLLNSFTFKFGSLTGIPSTLYILSSSPVGNNISTIAGSAYLTSSSSFTTASDTNFGNSPTATFSFTSGATLSGGTTYYAIFGTDSGFSLFSTNTNSYGGGGLLTTTSAGHTVQPISGGDDTSFAASFTAVPEPSTYAALTGFGALGLAAWTRRRRV